MGPCVVFSQVRKALSFSETNFQLKFINRLWELIWSRLILTTYYLLWNVWFHIIQKCPEINLSEKKTGETCVLTGSTRGIGIEILKKLLQLDYTIVTGVRNASLLQAKIKEIRKSGIYTGQVKTLYLDLKSLSSVKAFAQSVLKLAETKRIDLLLNNAGISQKNYEITEDNVETHFQVNYLSHYLLTRLLLPRIKETAKAKCGTCHIVNTSSVAHHLGNLKLRLNNLIKSNPFVNFHAYVDTKLCQVLHAKTVQEQLMSEGVQNVQMYAVHPGNIPTEIWSSGTGVPKAVVFLFKRICRTSKDAANVVLYPAISKNTSGNCGGKYYDTGIAIKSNPQADDLSLRLGLLRISDELTKGY